MGSELYKLQDRTGSQYLLAPTFEEEITKLIGKEAHSWRNLPVKVYQISRKYRDEPRPRNGLLRTREFLMKDLYTFDADVGSAEESYKQVREAYHAIMTRLFGVIEKNWRVAEADTGAMGGSQSHEYQVLDEAGEDSLLICNNCSYTANEELAASFASPQVEAPVASEDLQVSLFGSEDLLSHSCVLSAVIVPKNRKINQVKVARHITEENRKLLSLHSTWDWKDRPEGPMIRFDKLQIILDPECRAVEVEETSQAILQAIESFAAMPSGNQVPESKSSNAPALQDYFQGSDAITMNVADIHVAEANDRCASCSQGSLQHTKSIEAGHTFLLGTRYSRSLDYTFAASDGKRKLFQMGCYGIGITRILGVLAQIATRKFQAIQGEEQSTKRQGLAWNFYLAPFTALILPSSWDESKQAATTSICEALLNSGSLLKESVTLKPQDIAIDDRSITVGRKLSEADLVGYPLVFILGKHFEKTGEVEFRQRIDNTVKSRMIPLLDFQQKPIN